MAEGGTVADHPAAAPASDPKPADRPKSDGAFGSETRPPSFQLPDPAPRTETKGEVMENAQKPAVASDAQAKKRKPDPLDELRNSAYFKIRSIIRDLRPSFIEVIHSPDFRECKAANDIKKQLKTMVELSKQLTTEPSVAVPQPQNGEAPSSLEKGTANVPVPGDKIPEVTKITKQSEEVIQGTHVIGGSPVGWNFFVLHGSNPVYYGVTKESFRSRQIVNRS